MPDSNLSTMIYWLESGRQPGGARLRSEKPNRKPDVKRLGCGKEVRSWT